MAQSRYAASDDLPQEQAYQVLLSDVRKRPCMWTGSTDAHGLHRLLENVLALGLSESHEGRCTRISVTLAADRSVTVEHDGQGLAGQGDAELGLVTLVRTLTNVEINKHLYRVTPYESCLYAVNALSTRLSVEVHYGGTMYRQSYTMGVPDGPTAALGPTSGQGLRLTFQPDPTIFESEFSQEALETRLRELAFLHAELRCTLSDERPDQLQRQHFQFKDGLGAFARYISLDSKMYYTDPIYVTGQYETGEVSAVLLFSMGTRRAFALYANDHATPRGGTGLTGLLSGAACALTRIGRREGLLMGKEDAFCRHDVMSGLTAILSVHLDSIAYGGNTCSRIANPELLPQVQWLVEQQLDAYFTAHPDRARKVVQHCLDFRDSIDWQLLPT